jgi:hypothetical protein
MGCGGTRPQIPVLALIFYTLTRSPDFLCAFPPGISPVVNGDQNEPAGWNLETPKNRNLTMKQYENQGDMDF